MDKNGFGKYAGSPQFKPNFGLFRIRELLRLLGNPENDVKIIHAAGTNGKGSVCRFLQSILTEAGLKTGMFLSPCLTDSCEAISVDGVCITNNELDKLYEEIRAFAEKAEQLPTQFEINTAAAFMYFKAKKCDYCILETGMGGAEDATNAAYSSVIDIFTPIDVDHSSYLGNTVSKIAEVKSGIIKPNSCVISSPQQKEAECVLRRAAGDNKFIAVSLPEIIGCSNMHTVFDYKNLRNIKCGLIGEHQAENASVAAEAALQLGIDENHIKNGIENTKNPARFEVFGGDGRLIFDGAHNPHGMRAFVSCVNKYFGGCPKTVVYASMADKDIKSVISELKKIKGRVKFFTVGVSGNERAASPQLISEMLSDFGLECINAENIKSALLYADKSNPLFVCGTLYLYHEFCESLKELGM